MPLFSALFRYMSRTFRPDLRYRSMEPDGHHRTGRYTIQRRKRLSVQTMLFNSRWYAYISNRQPILRHMRAEIPCQISNMAPSLQFDFGACASILNPTLTAAEDGAITLSGSLVVTPQVRMQVLRPSLFNLNAREVCLPCDDIGQCNPCDTWEAECFNSDECCCGQSSVNRIDELLDQRSAVSTRNLRQTAVPIVMITAASHASAARQTVTAFSRPAHRRPPLTGKLKTPLMRGLHI